MTDRSGFEFPGYVLKGIQDSTTHLVETGVVQDGNHSFVLTMIRPKTVPNGVPFLVKEVGNVGGVQLWTFEETRGSADEFCIMAKAVERPVIAIVRRGREGAVLRVIPLITFTGKRFDIATLIGLKRAAAEFLGRNFELTQAEQTVNRILADRQQQEEAAQKEAARKLAEANREARIKRILVRDPVEVRGGERWGTPVIETEWQSLPHNTFVVLVTSFDEETEEYGQILETFRVVKERGKNPTKGNRAIVSDQVPATKTAAQPERVKPINTALIEIELGNFQEVPLYASQEALRRAREQGLNSGSYAGVVPNGTKEVTIFSVHHDKVETIGKFTAMAFY